MRYQELTEAKVIKIDAPGEGLDLKVYASPTRLDIINLLSKYDELRGIITPDGKHYVWDAFSAIHFQIAAELGYQDLKHSYLADDIEALMFINDLDDVGKSSEASEDWPVEDYFDAGDFYIGGHLTKEASSLARYIGKKRIKKPEEPYQEPKEYFNEKGQLHNEDGPARYSEEDWKKQVEKLKGKS